MFTLLLERGRYLKVRSGVSKSDIERDFSFPVHDEIFTGAIILIAPRPKGYCYALPGDSYESIAKRQGADCEEIKRYNGNNPLYPSKKVWLP